jgi:putative hydrolase of the HAD superfamily
MAHLKNKTNLFFDLDDTLWDFKANSGVILSALFEEFGLEKKLNTSLHDFLTYYRKLNLQLWSRYYKREIDKHYLRNYRFKEVFNHFGYDHYEESLLVSEAYMTRAPFGTALKEGCIETLTYLKTKYKLHIITNGFVESQAIKIDSCGLRPFFSNIIISEEHALVKPELRIFRVAESLAESQPHECVMIGDSMESDVQGALNAGWDAVYLRGENDSEYSGTCIQRLAELMELF